MPNRGAIDQHVGRGDKLLEHLTAPIFRRIQRNATLAGVVVPEEEAAIRFRLILIERLVSTRGVARSEALP